MSSMSPCTPTYVVLLSVHLRLRMCLCVLTELTRFDGRPIRVDRASDTGPKGGYGARGGYASVPRGAYGQPQMAYGGGQPGPYDMRGQNMYAPQPAYGRGGYPPQPIAYGGPPPQQGKSFSFFSPMSTTTTSRLVLV